MIIDAHMHICPSYHGIDSEPGLLELVDGIVSEMDAAGVGGGILAGNTIRHDQLDFITTRYRGRFVGLLNMVPDMDENLKQIDRYGGNESIIGVKVYPNLFPGSAIIKPLEPVFAAIKDRRWIVQVHSNPVVLHEVGLPLHVVHLAQRVDLPVVMVHSGGHQFQQLYTLGDSVPDNLFFDTSSVQNVFQATPFQSHLAWLFRRLGHRLLWASDYPAYSFQAALDAIGSYGFTEDEISDICHNNCARFLRTHVGAGLDGFAGL